MTTALLTDRYELTMLDSALKHGTHQRQCVFETYSRRLSGGRRYGVVAGTGRVLDAIEAFRFDDETLSWLSAYGVVSDEALDLLSNYRFRGTITGYREGELYFPHSPVLTVSGEFWECVLLETVILSIMNHDSAIATAASRMFTAAEGRPLAEMGSRRTHEYSAVAAARAAYIAGFSATSNLEAGRSWGVPTMGTAAHAFTLLHDGEQDAFQAQINSHGTETTLLIDTYNMREGVANAIRVAGPNLASVRIDSGDLPVVVREVREQLDSLGAVNTKIVVTNDLDEYAIAGLSAVPVDSFGVGTQLVTGSGVPTAGMVYKLVARENAAGKLESVAKTSAGKTDLGGNKKAYRLHDEAGTATAEVVQIGSDQAVPENSRELQLTLFSEGKPAVDAVGIVGVERAKNHHLNVMAELPRDGFRLAKGDPVIPTDFL